jgi:hypothetical protein
MVNCDDKVEQIQVQKTQSIQATLGAVFANIYNPLAVKVLEAFKNKLSRKPD